MIFLIADMYVGYELMAKKLVLLQSCLIDHEVKIVISPATARNSCQVSSYFG